MCVCVCVRACVCARVFTYKQDKRGIVVKMHTQHSRLVMLTVNMSAATGVPYLE